jgi:hypothetical protein
MFLLEARQCYAFPMLIFPMLCLALPYQANKGFDNTSDVRQTQVQESKPCSSTAGNSATGARTRAQAVSHANLTLLKIMHLIEILYEAELHRIPDQDSNRENMNSHQTLCKAA